MNERPPERILRKEGGVRGFTPLRNKGNGVETVITDKVESEEEDELESEFNPSNSSSGTSITTGN